MYSSCCHPVGVEALEEVALGVEQPDGDQRHAQVRRALQVVAGEHAEAARVDRQRLVQAELGREVRHGPCAQDAGVDVAPRRLGSEIGVQPSVGVMDLTVQRQGAGALLDPAAVSRRAR